MLAAYNREYKTGYDMPEGAKIRADFADPDLPIEPAEQRSQDDWELEKNLITPVDLMIRSNPDLTPDEAEQRLKDNQALNNELSSETSGLFHRFEQRQAQQLNERLKMPINTTDIKQILNTKSEIIAVEQTALENLFAQKGVNLINALVPVIESGGFNLGIILDVLDQLGFDVDVLDSLSMFAALMNYSKQLSEAMGMNILLSRQAESQLTAFIGAYENKLKRMFRDEIADDLFVFAAESKLAGRTSTQIVLEGEARLAPLGRRAGTEVSTALSAFDRATMGMYYEEAEIEKYVYWGPDDDVNRDTCQSALDDPRQQTGWTREEIDAHDGVDFVLGGRPYYNCRHEWIPFGILSPEVV